MNLRPRRPGGARRERRHPVVKNYPQPSWQLSELTSPRGLAAFQATSSEFDHSTARSHRLEAGAAAKATQRRHAHTHKTMEFRNLLNSARQITTIHPVSSNLTPSPLGSARVRNHRAHCPPAYRASHPASSLLCSDGARSCNFWHDPTSRKTKGKIEVPE